uniref:G-protein coupled receptors family 1 profile domain-containing protein n=2 Tax=Magallana gigas TaxID=29159 RepID=A0A8W8MCX8_MAGGI
MDNDSYYHLLLENKTADIALGSTILIIIGGVIGVIGNSLIIYFYFFRVKERGERYFIPVLGVVDLLGCLTGAPFYIMDNTFLFYYPSTVACSVLSFLQVWIPGISMHMLLVISLQRYLLVCKPFGPKMTLFWKRISIAIVCFVSIAFSAPLLKTSGISKERNVFMGYNLTTYICRFSDGSTPGMFAYFAILFLVMLANLVVTVGLYIPVLKRINLSFSFKSKTYEIHHENNLSSQTDTTNASETDGHQCTEHGVEQQAKRSIEMHFSKKVHLAASDYQPQENSAENIANEHSESQHIPEKSSNSGKKLGSKTESAQRRITIMFFVIIVAYVISYTPPLIISILLYALDDFTFISMTRAELAVCFYLTRLVFLNHIVNPFVYGYFDTKFRKQLMTWCKRGK